MNSSHQYSVRLLAIGIVVLLLAPLVVFAESRGGHYTPAELFEQSTLVIHGAVVEIEIVDKHKVSFPTRATVEQVLKGNWQQKEIGFKHKHPDRNVILVEEFNPPAKGQKGTFYLQEQNGILVLIGYIKETEPPAPAGKEAVYGKAKARSKFILDCTVEEEGPLAHGPNSIFKPCRVRYKPLFWGIVGLDLGETIWIYFDLAEYPEELRSGIEAEQHKGDRFLAFVDWNPEKKGTEFRLVRADKAADIEAIRRVLTLDRADHQQVADQSAFEWRAEQAGAEFCERQLPAGYRLQSKPAPPVGGIRFALWKADREVFAFAGHAHSVFRLDGDVSYYAIFTSAGNGCEVAAHDLKNGKQLWRSSLKGIGQYQHSTYRNLVTLDLDRDAVIIRGHESFGDYFEFLDRATGRTIGHRTFNLRFPPKPPAK